MAVSTVFGSGDGQLLAARPSAHAVEGLHDDAVLAELLQMVHHQLQALLQKIRIGSNFKLFLRKIDV
jgi:hypothetical protein